MIRIALDAMGFENDIKHAVIAANNFLAKHKDVQILIIGVVVVVEQQL